jgi:hypothetical protein
MILLAYAPAAILAAVAVSRDAVWRRRCHFLITAAAVSFLLANHQWFMTPHQPIHFTRGYIWTPLWLAGLPVLVQLLNWGTQVHRRWPSLATAALGVLIVSDNAGFLATSSVHSRDYGFGLSRSERDAFVAISQLSSPGVLLTDESRLGYLAAVYTPARPWLGHKYNTPRFDDRKQIADRLASGASAEIPPEIGQILTRSSPFNAQLYANGWTEMGRFESLVLWRRSQPVRALATRPPD